MRSLVIALVLIAQTAFAAAPVLVVKTNGTIYDSANNLTWLKKANCFGSQNHGQATASAGTLATGSCGLADGSTAGMWRLPTLTEWQTMASAGLKYNTLEAAGFVDVLPYDVYWSSTDYSDAKFVYYISLLTLATGYKYKFQTGYAWPVRTGL